MVFEMSELNTDKPPAASKPSIVCCLMVYCVSVIMCFRLVCVNLKKDTCKNVSPSLSSLCQPLMTQPKDRQCFMGLKLSASRLCSWNGWCCLCVCACATLSHVNLCFSLTTCTWVCFCAIPEPAYVSRTVSPVVVTVSLLFIGSVFT